MTNKEGINHKETFITLNKKPFAAKSNDPELEQKSQK